jgi:protein-disulfide isomerase
MIGLRVWPSVGLLGLLPPLAAIAASASMGRVGDTPIPPADVERRVAVELLRVRNEEYAILRRGLDDAIAEQVLTRESGSLGVSVETLIDREVKGKVTTASDADVAAFHAANAAQMPGDLPTMRDELRRYLNARAERERYEAYVRQLEAKYGVLRLLDPPRTAVDAAGFPSRGPESAAVTIVEFSDFECPFCRSATEPLRRLLQRYPDEVRLVYRHYPLSDIHPGARVAAEASLCAEEQAAFWPFHDALFAAEPPFDPAKLATIAEKVPLDMARFGRCLDEGRYAPAVAADVVAAERAGVNGTPALFVNGRFINGAASFETLVSVVEDELGIVARAVRTKP